VRRRVALAALGAAIALPPFGAAGSAQPVRLRLASTTNDDVTPVLYAQAVGLFRAAGLDVELQAVSNGTAVTAAVVGGAVDIGRSSMLPLISAFAHGVPIALVGPSGLYAGTATQTGGIIVLADSPVRIARDLTGKVVSVPGLNDVLDIGTRSWIDRNGGDSNAIHFIETTGPQAAVALDSGRVAAATLVNPLLAQDLATGRYRMVGDPLAGIGPRVLVAAWFAGAAFSTRNAATIRTFDGVLEKASAYCNAHPQQTIDLLAKFSGIDVVTIAHMTRAHYDLTLDPRDIQPLIDAAARYKVIPKAFAAAEMIASGR
jgi:NitT/TauT family transport system substrate-binding protein